MEEKSFLRVFNDLIFRIVIKLLVGSIKAVFKAFLFAYPVKCILNNIKSVIGLENSFKDLSYWVSVQMIFIVCLFLMDLNVNIEKKQTWV